MKMIQNIQTLSMRVDKIPVVSVINKSVIKKSKINPISSSTN